MYLDELKSAYYQERKKLDTMACASSEAKLRFLKLRADMLERMEANLSLGELDGRNDIHEEIKERYLRERANGGKFETRIREDLDAERDALENELKDALREVDYSPQEYADYLFQMEKVFALENALLEEKAFPDQVFYEMSMKEKNG